MTVYYDYADDGTIKPVKNRTRQTVGLKYISERRAFEMSDGKYSKSGWLLSDNVCAPTHYSRSDDLGTQGILNHADGKRYDSRSAYYKALKQQGMVILGDDAPKTAAKPKESGIDWKKAVKETIDSYKTPKKGKTK